MIVEPEEEDKVAAEVPEDVLQEQEEQGNMDTAKPSGDAEPVAENQDAGAGTDAVTEAKEATPPTEKAVPEEATSRDDIPQADAEDEAKDEAEDEVNPDAEVVAVAKEEKEEKETLVEDPEEEEETDEVKLAVKEAANLPEGFVEWEAVSFEPLQHLPGHVDMGQDLRVPV